MTPASPINLPVQFRSHRRKCIMWIMKEKQKYTRMDIQNTIQVIMTIGVVLLNMKQEYIPTPRS